jgi:hypothetical protein
MSLQNPKILLLDEATRLDLYTAVYKIIRFKSFNFKIKSSLKSRLKANVMCI